MYTHIFFFPFSHHSISNDMGIMGEISVTETELDLIDTLETNGVYYFTVRAINSVGEGPASSPVVYNGPCKFFTFIYNLVIAHTHL